MAKRPNQFKKSKQEKAADALRDLYFKNLDKIYETCEKSAHSYGAVSVPLEFIKLCHDKVKESFNQGFKQQKPKS